MKSFGCRDRHLASAESSRLKEGAVTTAGDAIPWSELAATENKLLLSRLT